MAARAFAVLRRRVPAFAALALLGAGAARGHPEPTQTATAAPAPPPAPPSASGSGGSQPPGPIQPTIKRFEERAQCFVDQYAHYHADDGTPVDGKLTLGENIADNGGIRLSYAALKPSEEGPLVDGFTPAQRFFLAWAQIRCENVTPEAAHRQAMSNEHAPGRARTDAVVSNMPEFASAFQCEAGAPMAPVERCVLW